MRRPRRTASRRLSAAGRPRRTARPARSRSARRSTLPPAPSAKTGSKIDLRRARATAPSLFLAVKTAAAAADRRTVTVSLSPQIRIVALLGLLAAVCLAAGLRLLGRSNAEPVAATPTVQRVDPQPAKRVHPQVHAHAKPTPATTPHKTQAVTRAKAPAATRTPAVKHAAPKPKPAVAANGLPTRLDDLLRKHRVVVVAFFDPDSPVDGTALAEARSGAAAAHVGFLAVNVLDERLAAPLAGSLTDDELLPDPGILVYRAPGRLVARFDGFLDQTAVAQAAANARP